MVIYPVDGVIHLLNNGGQAAVIQMLDSAIHWMNRYPVDNYQGNQ